MVLRVGMSPVVMAKYYRVVFEAYDSHSEAPEQANILLEGSASAPSSCLDFGIRHQEQINLIPTFPRFFFGMKKLRQILAH